MILTMTMMNKLTIGLVLFSCAVLSAQITATLSYDYSQDPLTAIVPGNVYSLALESSSAISNCTATVGGISAQVIQQSYSQYSSWAGTTYYDSMRIVPYGGLGTSGTTTVQAVCNGLASNAITTNLSATAPGAYPGISGGMIHCRSGMEFEVGGTQYGTSCAPALSVNNGFTVTSTLTGVVPYSGSTPSCPTINVWINSVSASASCTHTVVLSGSGYLLKTAISATFPAGALYVSGSTTATVVIQVGTTDAILDDQGHNSFVIAVQP